MNRLTKLKLKGLSEEVEKVFTRLFAKSKPKLKYEINSKYYENFHSSFARNEREHKLNIEP